MFQAFTAKLDGLKEGGTGVSIFCVHVRLSEERRRAFGASSLGEPNIEYRHSSLSFNSHHPSLISQTSGLSLPKGACSLIHRSSEATFNSTREQQTSTRRREATFCSLSELESIPTL